MAETTRADVSRADLMQPLAGRVLIQPDVPAETTPSGLVMVRRWNPEITGTIVALGARSRCACGRPRPPAVAVGDHVVFSYQRGTVVTLNQERYVVLNDADLLAILVEDTEDQPDAR